MRTANRFYATLLSALGLGVRRREYERNVRMYGGSVRHSFMLGVDPRRLRRNGHRRRKAAGFAR